MTETAFAKSIATDRPLSESVSVALQNYLTTLDGQEPSNIYEMVIREVQKPMLEVVMKYVRGNQSRAAIIMGLSRGTLRKLLKIHDMLD